MTGRVLVWSEAATHAAVYAGIAIAAALAVHFLLFRLIERGARLSRSGTDDVIVDALRRPARWSLVAVALAVAQEGDATLAMAWGMVARFIEPALFGWMAYALLQAATRVLHDRAEAGADKQMMRSSQTRITIFSRMASFLIVFVTIALILFGIPAVRNIGVTLMASAGLATLAVGAAAQPALKSLVAGLQIALTEPLRLGDYVVIDGEGGRVEDIRLSYVVIRTGDERRVVVPTGKFLDSSFQNWTRVGGGITGSVTIPVKPDAEVAPIRAAYLDILKGMDTWDKRTGSLQVSEVSVGAMELKLVMSASGPTDLGPLRAAVRERVLEWLRLNMPDALCKDA